LISKLLDVNKELQRLTKELFFPLHMIRKSKSIYDDQYNNRQAHAEFTSLKGIGQVYINENQG
jgi:hypothetical protein